MVGDRIDNDIAPATTLGMRTVLFRTGRHAAQQPRSTDAGARFCPGDGHLMLIEHMDEILAALFLSRS